MSYTVEHFIKGEKYAEEARKFHDIFNPAQGEVI